MSAFSVETAVELAIPDLPCADRVAAFDEVIQYVFASLHPHVLHYLVSLVGNTAEAEDITQEVFLRLWMEVQAGRRITSVRPWCFRVAHNLAASEGRRKRTRNQYRLGAGESALERHAQSGIEETLVSKENSRQLAKALSKLSGMERRCLALRTDGLRYREIGEALDIRIPTVQTLLTRAMKKISGSLRHPPAHGCGAFSGGTPLAAM